VDEFGRTSLLMLAASIGSEDRWVMAASCGAITLTPLRMMTDDERRSATDRSALLLLTDLGYLHSTDNSGAELATSPLRTSSVVVLLLPWSLVDIVARLDVLARNTTVEIPRCYAPEDWLAAGHHFVDDGEWNPADLTSDVAKRANALRGLPAAERRHFIFGALAGETPALDRDLGRSSHGDGSGRTTSTTERSSRDVDPLVFTNPGSMPEGVSPLFVSHKDRSI
jgi:hypothetical protein